MKIMKIESNPKESMKFDENLSAAATVHNASIHGLPDLLASLVNQKSALLSSRLVMVMGILGCWLFGC